MLSEIECPLKLLLFLQKCLFKPLLSFSSYLKFNLKLLLF